MERGGVILKTNDTPKLRAGRSWVVGPAIVGRSDSNLAGVAFGLSALEQQVVQRLILGQGPIEIADACGIAALAARTSIKRVYAKLDVHCRADLLVRLVGHLTH